MELFRFIYTNYPPPSAYNSPKITFSKFLPAQLCCESRPFEQFLVCSAIDQNTFSRPYVVLKRGNFGCGLFKGPEPRINLEHAKCSFVLPAKGRILWQTIKASVKRGKRSKRTVYD
ncbi:hypothetical protein CDAR_398181 [Caerostris darwini]|uniref:Uncharacterized protein n=1 Tax=Caerostris darwini TaxID=1538125 RepID=A0AAV4WQ74_9ARAC|nr:hypothetical protein CDAR_398181 [Caerostris darwini]